MHVKVIIVRAGSQPGDTGIEVDADLTYAQQDKIRDMLKERFEAGRIDDYGIDPVPDILSYEGALTRIYGILGK